MTNYKYTEHYQENTWSIEEAISYDKEFLKNRRTGLIWEFEKEVISRVYAEIYSGRTVTHLDFACGTGRVINFLSSKTNSSIGVDTSEKMLEIAKKNNPSCKFINVNIAQKNVFLKDKFDLITAFRFFPNAEHDLRDEIMRELKSLLKIDGYIIFNNHQNHLNIKKIGLRILNFFKNKKSQHITNQKELEDLIIKHDMLIIKKIGIGYIPETEKLCIHPRFLIKFLEKLFLRTQCFKRFAEDIIYVIKENKTCCSKIH